MDAILVGLEKTACLIDRCTVYEVLYTNRGSDGSKPLEQSIVQLYTAILKFLAEAIRMLNGDRRKSLLSTAADYSSDNHLKAAFTEGISSCLNEIERLEQTVGRDASIAEAQCIIHLTSKNIATRF